ncbi:hypothetical protein AB0J38_14150 [Streptomyces sp. NPDC050095]|uniref:hypothetical protein n=1 Tax=unclassified Streptomyces TaxID=2593676 RepID=UPI003422D8EC
MGGLVVAAVTAGVACQPVDGQLTPANVASTTDREATVELNRQHANVQSLSCTASYSNGREVKGSSTPDEVTVDCRGKAKEGRNLTLKGWAYGVVPGRCVRGSFIARIDGKVWFHLQVLGNCATPDSTPRAPGSDDKPAPKPKEHRTPRTPTVTKTVTVTVTAQPGK